MPQHIDLVVHVSHEAGCKIGGIGAVLHGLLTASSYREAVSRSVLVGALEPGTGGQVFAARNHLHLLYAPGHGIQHLDTDLARRLQEIEVHYGVAILYGHRQLGEIPVEVLLVEVSHAWPGPVDATKYALWQRWGLDSSRYEHDAEYERYLRLAAPAYAALYHLAADAGPRRVLISHEWMGMPLLLTARTRDPDLWQTVFYAHEVATARLLVEQDPGHDLRFYSALRAARPHHQTMDEVFGDQGHYFKHALIQLAASSDHVLAVGEPVVDELRFLGGGFAEREIHRVFNGVPQTSLLLEQVERSRERLREYASRLLGFRPDHVFSHVTRLVISKALWRDLRVLHHLDPLLAREGRSAVLFVLSTAEPTGHDPADVHHWEAEYGWPVAHRPDDLRGHEAAFAHGVQAFNASARAIRVVFVNQFGWDTAHCGTRMPQDMGFSDLRAGVDLEFGQSIYEPFGIAQVEPLGAGALCVVSDVCGCADAVRQAAGEGAELPNLIVAPYTRPPQGWHFDTPWDALDVDQYGRDLVEDQVGRAVAATIHERLPRTQAQRAWFLASGTRIAQRMSWEHVVAEQLLPALE